MELWDWWLGSEQQRRHDPWPCEGLPLGLDWVLPRFLLKFSRTHLSHSLNSLVQINMHRHHIFLLHSWKYIKTWCSKLWIFIKVTVDSEPIPETMVACTMVQRASNYNFCSRPLLLEKDLGLKHSIQSTLKLAIKTRMGGWGSGKDKRGAETWRRLEEGRGASTSATELPDSIRTSLTT